MVSNSYASFIILFELLLSGNNVLIPIGLTVQVLSNINHFVLVQYKSICYSFAEFLFWSRSCSDNLLHSLQYHWCWSHLQTYKSCHARGFLSGITTLHYHALTHPIKPISYPICNLKLDPKYSKLLDHVKVLALVHIHNIYYAAHVSPGTCYNQTTYIFFLWLILPFNKNLPS